MGKSERVREGEGEWGRESERDIFRERMRELTKKMSHTNYGEF